MLAELETRFQTMEAQKAEILNRMDALSAEARTKRPDTKTWSPQQVTEHLIIYEELLREWIEAAEKAPGKTPGLRGKLFLTLVRWMISTRLRFGTLPEMEPRGETALEALRPRWQAIRIFLADKLTSLSEAEKQKAFALNPVAGPLNAEQVLILVEEHLKYHLKHWPDNA